MRNKRKKFKAKKIISIIIYIILLIIFVISTYKILMYFKDVEKASIEIESINKEITTVVKEKKPEVAAVTKVEEKVQIPWNKDFMSISFDRLKQLNSDTVGWIKVDNTKVNYPVVQSTDNLYYLDHTFYKSKSLIGWIFQDYRNNAKDLNFNTIIYGHSELLNESMFTTLTNTLKKSWQENKEETYIHYNTPYLNGKWKVFSVYKTKPVLDYLSIEKKSKEEKLEFINLLKSRSVHNFNVEVLEEDKIITLSTCYNNDQRLVIHAVLE